MSSTNKTTNYELSQFIGADKPAWLQDYNTDMSKIDTGIHNAATTATGADGKADANTTAIGTLSNLTTDDKTNVVAAINEVKSGATTAQNTANTANTTANGCRTDLNKFNLTDTSTLTTTVNLGTLDPLTSVRFAVDTTNSIYKLYGRVRILSLTNVTGNLLVKLGETSLRPSTAYMINNAATIYLVNTNGTYSAIGSRDIKIDTDGSVYIYGVDGQSTTYLNGTTSTIDISMPPCLYFNTNFGD